MKTIYVLAITLALTLVLSVQAQTPTGPTDTDTMSKMTISKLQNYLGGLSQANLNMEMQSILATNNARFIRVGIAAAQRAINAKPVADRPAILYSLLATNPGLTGTVGANGSVLLAQSTATPKTGKICVDVPNAASETASSATP